MRLIDNASEYKTTAERNNALKSRKQKTIKRKLDIVFDDLENFMLVEEAVADANEIVNEKPLRKKSISEKSKKRPLEDANVVVSAKHPRGRPRKNSASFFSLQRSEVVLEFGYLCK